MEEGDTLRCIGRSSGVKSEHDDWRPATCCGLWSCTCFIIYINQYAGQRTKYTCISIPTPLS